MTSRYDYKYTLSRLDKDTRTCILYLEELINGKIRMVLSAQPTSPPRVDLSKIETMLDSLQKQIDGLRPKIEAGYTLAQEHDEQEKYLKKLTKNVEAVLGDMKSHFEELYKSGFYSEGARRKIRDEGLLDMREEKV